MPRKKEEAEEEVFEEEVEETTEEEVVEVEKEEAKVCTGCITKLDFDLGRGDLNLLRDKINELVDKSNGN